LISDTAIQQFYRDGAVTIDTPLTASQLDRAVKALDRLVPEISSTDGNKRHRAGATCSFFDPELLDIIQHSFFEAVAQQVLQTESVRFFQAAIVNSYPQPGVPFGFDQHIDMQYRSADLEAVPKRIVCSFFLWLSDVTPPRAPLIFRPGSHRCLAEAWEKDEDLHHEMPRVKGIKLDQLPALDFAEPQPLLANAGQVTVLTTGMVHGASVNLDTEPRRAFVITFHAKGLRVGLPQQQEETKRAYDEELRKLLRPERVHIVTD
jgi:ectoine hydroxylase-related dioxygenase (phytanoyl-CoA dioxygenase family)